MGPAPVGLGATEIKPFANRLPYRFGRGRERAWGTYENMLGCRRFQRHPQSGATDLGRPRIPDRRSGERRGSAPGLPAQPAGRDPARLEHAENDGYDFLRLLRRLPGGDRPKVVFCTTENDVAHIARALHAGANEYIMKPFDKEIVEAKFQEVGLV
jgi:CheY-like chemotaxis protein